MGKETRTRLWFGLVWPWLAACALGQIHGTDPATSRPEHQVPGGIHHQVITAEPSLEEWLGPTAIGRFLRNVAVSLEPNDGGALAIGLVILLVVACSFRPFRFGWNLQALLLIGVAICFADLVPRQFALDRDGQRGAFTLAFTIIYALTGFWALRAIAGAFGSEARAWSPTLPTGTLATLALLLVGLNVLIGVVREPDDCGVYTNLGTQRMLEAGTFPYGDARLRGGAAATYGPVLYLSHAPLRMLGGAIKQSADADPNSASYERPPVWITKAVCIAFHIAGLFALFFAARRLAGAPTALAIVCLYAGSAYVLGVGGGPTRIGGMGYISHIAPAALTLLGFVALRSPVACGALLALAAGTVYYPAFFFPLWWSYHRTRGRALRFTLGFVATGALLGGAVVAFTHTEPGQNAVSLFFQSTLEHQEAPDQYGSSPFSFFGVHPDLRKSWNSPIASIGSSSLLKPTFLLVTAVSLLGFLFGRRRRPAQLALLTAAVAATVQLWKTHATGSYVEWYYPFLLLGLFADRDETADLAPGSDAVPA